MKRVFTFLFLLLLIVTFSVAVYAADDAPLVIVDATRRTPFSDLLEGFTVKNVSDKTLDLSDFKVWYGRAKTQEELNVLQSSSVKHVMPLAESVGEYILEPGQMAYIFFVYSATYKTEVDTAEGKAMLVEQGADGKPVYRIDNFRKAIAYLQAEGSYRVMPISDETIVVPIDVTTGTEFGAEATYTNKSGYLNLQNSYYIRLYLTEYNARSTDEAFCTADLDGTGNGTYLNASGDVKCNFGTFVYEKEVGEIAMKVASFEAGTYLFGNKLPDEIILPVEPTPSDAFRVMSINVRNDDYKTSRFGYIEKTVETLSPDIIGFQECREGFDTLIDNITKNQGYVSVLSTLKDDAESNIVNCVKILYNPDKYTLVENSEGARRFKEKYQDSWTKSLCYCVLEDNETKERMIVINVHFAVYSSTYVNITASEVEKQRESNAIEVLEKIKAMQEIYGDLPVVVMGDFNMDEPERANRILQTVLRDAAYISGESYPWKATYHASLEGTQTGGYPIDHVFVSSEDFEVVRVLPYTDSIGKKASDHYPLYADLKLSSNNNTSCKDVHKAEAPLAIVDATRRTPTVNGSGTSDTLEGFTVMNVSDSPVDLSHILVWYNTAKTEEGLDQVDPATITFVMRLSDRTGEYILLPGQKAFIWNVYSTVYKAQGATADGLVNLVEQGENGDPVYLTDNFRKVLKYLASNTEDEYDVSMIEEDTLIVPLDRTTRDAFGADGYRNLAKSFNLVNSAYIRLFLTYDTANGAEEAFCVADLDGTNDGTYINADGGVSVNFGTYKYIPGEGKNLKIASFDLNKYYYGTSAEGFGVSKKTVVKMTIGQAVGYINDVEKALDAAPIIRESRTMLPVRFVAEAFGAEVAWDGATSTATVKTEDVEIKITIGSNIAVVNGNTVTLDVPAFIENSRTYMPVRFVAENLGATVIWDGATSTATLTK